MAKGALEDLEGMRKAQAEGVEWPPRPRKETVVPGLREAVKEILEPKRAVRATTHKKDAPVRAGTHAGYLGLATRIQERLEMGATVEEVAGMIGEAVGGKGGRTRAERMTPEARSESARRAAKARWNPETEGE